MAAILDFTWPLRTPPGEYYANVTQRLPECYLQRQDGEYKSIIFIPPDKLLNKLNRSISTGFCTSLSIRFA